MTNLIASIVVSLVTNISERLPMHSVQDPCPSHMIGCLVYHSHLEPEADPQRKWIRTTITEQTNLVSELAGRKFSVPWGSRIVSDIDVELTKKVVVTWTPVATNTIPPNAGLFGNRWEEFVTVMNGIGTNFFISGAFTNYKSGSWTNK